MVIMKKSCGRRAVRKTVLAIATATAFSCLSPISERLSGNALAYHPKPSMPSFCKFCEKTTNKKLKKLKKRLKSKSYYTRRNAAFELGLTGDRRAIPILTEAMNDSNVWVRETVYYAIKRIASFDPRSPELKKVLPELIRAFGDQNWSVRNAAVNAAVAAKNYALPLLLTSINTGNTDARCNVAAALGEIGSAKAFVPLMNALYRTKDFNIKIHTSGAVKKIAKLNKKSPEILRAVPLLIKALTSKNISFKFEVQDLLISLGKEVLPALEKARKNGSEDLRIQIVHVFSHIGSPAVPALVRTLKDKYWMVRYQSAISLGRLGKKDMIPVLEKVRWQDPIDLVREAAKQSIIRIKNGEKEDERITSPGKKGTQG
jgi:HEAT repeat protein